MEPQKTYTSLPKHDPTTENGGISPFPSWLITGVAGKFAQLYSRYTEFPQEFLYFGFLCCLGSIVAGKLWLKSALLTTTRLYVILLAESAYGRKSSSINAIVNFFYEFFRGILIACEGVGSAEGLLKQIQLASNQHLHLCLDELRALTSKMTIDSSTLLPCINTLFEHTIYESSTKNAGTKIVDAHLSILAASTLETYETLWTPQFLDIGFPNRLFLVPGGRKKRVPIPEQIPMDEKQLLAKEVSMILSKIGNKLELDLTAEAKSEYEKWYLGLKESVHTKRLDTYAMRFMLLLAINDQKSEVDLDTVKKVIEIMNWQKAVRWLSR